mgnify:FL=1
MSTDELPDDYIGLSLVEKKEYVDTLDSEVNELSKMLNEIRANSPKNLLSKTNSPFIRYPPGYKFKSSAPMKIQKQKILTMCTFYQGTDRNVSVATASQDGTAVCWDASGLKYEAFRIGKGNLMSVSANQSGRVLATGGLNCSLDFYSIGEELKRLSADPEPPFSFPKQTIADTEYGRPAQFRLTLAGPTSAVTGLAFLDDVKIVSGSQDGGINVFDISEAVKIMDFQEQVPINHIDNGTEYVFCSAGQDGYLKVWDIRRKHEEVISINTSAPLSKALFMSEGHSIMTSALNNLILMDLRSSSTLETYQSNLGIVSDFSISKSGRLAVCGFDSGIIHSLDVLENRWVNLIDNRKDVISGVSIIEDKVFCSSWDGLLKSYSPE